MRIRDHDQSANVYDLEEMSIMEFLDGRDPSTDEYTKAVDNLRTLQEVKKDEVEMKNQTKAGLVPQFATSFMGSALMTFGVVYMFTKETTGDAVLNTSTRSWMRALPKPRI